MMQILFLNLLKLLLSSVWLSCSMAGLVTPHSLGKNFTRGFYVNSHKRKVRYSMVTNESAFQSSYGNEEQLTTIAQRRDTSPITWRSAVKSDSLTEKLVFALCKPCTILCASVLCMLYARKQGRVSGPSQFSLSFNRVCYIGNKERVLKNCTFRALEKRQREISLEIRKIEWFFQKLYNKGF